VTSYEEWRVTGTPSHSIRVDWTYSLQSVPGVDPETAARQAIANITWVSGPHLSHRRVTVTEWEEAT
jgi:hypothetical protein